jgi:hypothetical protein
VLYVALYYNGGETSSAGGLLYPGEILLGLFKFNIILKI